MKLLAITAMTLTLALAGCDADKIDTSFLDAPDATPSLLSLLPDGKQDPAPPFQPLGLVAGSTYWAFGAE